MGSIPSARFARAEGTSALASRNLASIVGDRLRAQSIFERSKERLRFGLYGVLILADLTALALAFLAAGTLRLGAPFEPQTLRTLGILLPVFFAVALNNRSYSISALDRPLEGASRAVKALIYAVAVAIALLFYLKASVTVSRQVFAIGTILSLLSLVAVREVVCDWIGRRYQWNYVNRLLILDGAVIRPRHGEVALRAEMLGIEPSHDDPKILDRIGHLLKDCDKVVVACPPERRSRWTLALKGASTDVEILTPELTRFEAIGLGDFDGETTLKVCSKPLDLRDRVLKRALDLAIAIPAIAILAPLMLGIAIAIRIESRGPTLFRQIRVGSNNRMFELYKFRSMFIDDCDKDGVVSVSRGDDRITRVGRFIRATSLDELPQLLNVLKGSMSIVGPRPHALGSTAGEALFWHIDTRYFHRHAVKPGMTGLAQVRGFRGATDTHCDLTDRLQSDLEYMMGWTIWRDLKIILQTFAVIVHPRAY